MWREWKQLELKTVKRREPWLQLGYRVWWSGHRFLIRRGTWGSWPYFTPLFNPASWFWPRCAPVRCAHHLFGSFTRKKQGSVPLPTCCSFAASLSTSNKLNSIIISPGFELRPPTWWALEPLVKHPQKKINHSLKKLKYVQIRHNPYFSLILFVMQICTQYKSRICKRLGSPGNDSKESIPPDNVSCHTGTSNRVVVPARQ